MKYFVYQIQNKINGKSYIGITKNFDSRMKAHLNHWGSFVLFNAFKKYGEDHFDFAKLDKGLSWNEACEKEKQYILALNTKAPNGYNLTDGGDGNSELGGWNKGLLLSDSHKRSLSLAHTGLNVGENGCNHKLTDQDIINIRKKYKEGYGSYKKLAKEYNMSPVSIAYLIKGKSWSHIKEGILTPIEVKEISSFLSLKNNREKSGGNHHYFNKKRAEETRHKISEALKGRYNGQFDGEKSSTSKLKNNDVLRIRDRHNRGYSYQRSADIFSVSISTIYDIVNRRTWCHI